MDKNKYLHEISKKRQVQKKLNDIYIWSTLVSLTFEGIENNQQILEKIKEFKVPSKIRGKQVRRKSDDLVETIHHARSSEIYMALIVFVISLIEPILLEIAELTLLYDNRRLKIKPKGAESKLDYDTIVDCGNYNEVLTTIISKYTSAVSYSTPKEQLEYLQKILSIKIDEDVWNDWVEIKATRDLIVHGSGIINDVYLNKAGDSARGEKGQQIVVDDKYFEKVIVVGKSLVGQIVSRIVKEEKNKKDDSAN